MTTKTAAQIEPGDVIVRAGRTPHRPITVTAVRATELVAGSYIVVYGFNAYNPEPRLIFRSLTPSLPIEVQDATGPAAAQLEAARAALAAYDDFSIELIGADGYPLIGGVERAAYVIEALRPLVEASN